MGCTTAKTSTVGTLTGTALCSAITSAIDQVCEVPPNKGSTGTFSYTEIATATLAGDVQYTARSLAVDEWNDKGVLTLQVTEASYDSLLWYSTSKTILAALAQNSTQGECSY